MILLWFYGGLVIVSVKMLSLYHTNTDRRQKLRLFPEFSGSNLPCCKALEAELDLWGAYWFNDTSCHSENISSTLKIFDFKSFSNIKVYLRIQGTLPVTTCTCERSFSFTRRLNTYTRSTMISVRVNGRALMRVQKETVPNIEKVIDLFAVTIRRFNFI